MISLFVDTSYKSLFMALFKDKELLDKIQIMSEFNFSETMIPKLNDLLEKNNISSKDVSKIFVVVGPGSFTGIRIGLTACKTFAYAHNIPLVPLSSLEFMATTSVNTKYVIPMIDARHDMIFGGVYDNNGNSIVDDCYCSISSLLEKIDDSYTFVSFDEDLSNGIVLPVYDVSKIVLKHFNDSTVNCHAIKPNYLKKTEAEEKLHG